MKNIIPIVIVALFLLSGLGASALQSNDDGNEIVLKNSQTSTSSRDYTHTVLVEVGTATWCPSCPGSNTAWHNIYDGGNYDFEYTEMVVDTNSIANSRMNQFNLYWVPTSYWDGGFKVYPGTSTGTFYSYLDSSGTRTVPDLDAILGVSWLGSAAIEISYSIDNYEASNYPGRLRIYVIELVSTLWNDYNGNPYYHAFLDFAENKDINIPASGSITDTITWDGAAAGYPGITEDNIQVILAVFDDQGHQAYSDPPSGAPFTAYYSDECVAAIPCNGVRPYKPTIDGPTSGIVGQPYGYTASTTDPDGDELYYKVYWDDGTTSGWIGPYPSGDDAYIENIWENPGTYNVKVRAKDSSCGLISEWSDPITVTIENNPPEAPIITGETSGTSGTAYIYVLNSIDPNNDDVYYYIDWGDGNIEDWHGPYNSGKNHNEIHTFQSTGSFTIQAKSKDVHGSESGWGTLEVTMPREKSLKNLFLNFLETHPNMFPIIQLILQRLLI
jgi:hypothetical protein